MAQPADLKHLVRPTIFISSSARPIALAAVKKIKGWLTKAETCPHPWTDTFGPGRVIFSRLIEICANVHGAVVVFTPDDRVMFQRRGTSVPRDNVLIEFGMFLGRLGAENVIVCVQ